MAFKIELKCPYSKKCGVNIHKLSNDIIGYTKKIACPECGRLFAVRVFLSSNIFKIVGQESKLLEEKKGGGK